MWIGPPNALEWPKPMSSISTMTTFGAPSGAFTSKRGGACRLAGVDLGDVDDRRLGERQHGAIDFARLCRDGNGPVTKQTQGQTGHRQHAQHPLAYQSVYILTPLLAADSITQAAHFSSNGHLMPPADESQNASPRAEMRMNG